MALHCKTVAHVSNESTYIKHHELAWFNMRLSTNLRSLLLYCGEKYTVGENYLQNILKHNKVQMQSTREDQLQNI